MKFVEFTENINQVYSGKFAHSACIVRPYRCLGRYVYIDCMLAENLNEVSHGIAENDMFKISFCIDLPNNFNFETDELPENLTMEAKANSYVIKPENEYLYCNYKKIPYRKSFVSNEFTGTMNSQKFWDDLRMYAHKNNAFIYLMY